MLDVNLKLGVVGGEAGDRVEVAGQRRVAREEAEVVVLGQAVVVLVIKPVVAGDVAVAVGPRQGGQIDPANDVVVLAGPAPGDQFHRLGIGLVQGRIVQDEDAPLAIDQGAGLPPQGLGVGLQAVQESWAGESRASGCTLAAAVQENFLGLAIMKSMESVSRHLTRFIIILLYLRT